MGRQLYRPDYGPYSNEPEAKLGKRKQPKPKAAVKPVPKKPPPKP